MRSLTITSLVAVILAGCTFTPKQAIPTPGPSRLAAPAVTPKKQDSATVTIEPITPELTAAIAKFPVEVSLPTFGEKTDEAIRVTVTGAVATPGIYHLRGGSSFADAVSAAGGYSRLATSRFSIMRDGKFIRILIGSGGHYFSPVTLEILPLWILREKDSVYVAEVDPY